MRSGLRSPPPLQKSRCRLSPRRPRKSSVNLPSLFLRPSLAPPRRRPAHARRRFLVGAPFAAPSAPAAEAQPFSLQPGTPIGWHLGRSPEVPAPDAPPAQTVATPASPQPVIGQVAVAIARANEHRVEIRLDPPELGRVQIHLTPVDGGVQAVVLADRPETQDLLRRHAHALAQELGDAGFGSVSLDFAAGQQAAPDRGAPRPPPSFEPAPFVAGPSPTVAPAARPAVAAGALDIRL